MPSNYQAKLADLDQIFRLRTRPKRGNVSYAADSTDISNRYDPSTVSEDQINYDTNYTQDGTDLRYLFVNKNYIDPPTYAISPSTNSVNEGGAVTFNVTTTNVGNATLYYNTTLDGDLVNPVGSVNIVGNTGSFTINVKTDTLSEGAETFQVNLYTDASRILLVKTSSAVTINNVAPTYPDTLTFTLVQYLGDCFELYIGGSKNVSYRLAYFTSTNAGGSVRNYTKTFNPSVSPSSKRVYLLNQGWGANRFNLNTITLVENGTDIKTWDIRKSFYTNSDIDGYTTNAFTITNLSDQGNPDSVYTLSSNTIASLVARAIFTIGVS